MAYLGKGKKEDLLALVAEFEIQVDPSMTIVTLKNKIVENESYDEAFAKELFLTIVEERKRTEELRRKNEMEELEAQQKKDQMEFELRKLEIECSTRVNQTSTSNESGIHNLDLIKLIPKFKLREDDIVIYLSLFERQAKRSKVDPKDWVACLLTLLPSEIVQLIGRESEEKFEDYDYIKSILLKRFKLSPESFRKKFVMHQKSAEKSWRDFCYEITSYFEEWINGLDVVDFEALKDLIITDQLKKRVPFEIRDHLLDDWVKFISPTKLADKLDEYDSVRYVPRKYGVNQSNDKAGEKWRPRTPPPDRNFKNKSSSTQNAQRDFPFHRNDEPPRQTFKFTCYTCGKEGHTSKFCRKDRQPRDNSTTVQNNLIQTQPPLAEKETPEVLAAKISISVSKSVDISKNIDDLKLVKVKCGTAVLSGIVDSGTQISVVREKLITDIPCEGEGKIEISSAFGENEITPLKIFQMKIDDDVHGTIPITCAVSKKLVTDLLLSSSAYDMLCETIEVRDSSLLQKTSFECGKLDSEPCSSEDDNLPSTIINQISTKKPETVKKANETKLEFRKLQEQDPTLKNCHDWANKSDNSYAFIRLKEELIKMPSLHTPDLDKPFQLYTDASATAIGACLAQKDEKGTEMPIAFFSKKLNPCQMNWSTIEREAFCVLEALKKFDTWIFGAEIQIISDHNPLTYLTKSAPHGAQLSRLALAIQRYNMTVTYRKGPPWQRRCPLKTKF